MAECVTHHFACRCREERVAKDTKELVDALAGLMKNYNMPNSCVEKAGAYHTAKKVLDKYNQIK